MLGAFSGVRVSSVTFTFNACGKVFRYFTIFLSFAIHLTEYGMKFLLHAVQHSRDFNFFHDICKPNYIQSELNQSRTICGIERVVQ